MTEVENGLMAGDLMELEDVTDRVMTEEFLLGHRDWPFATCLPVKRWDKDHRDFEVGYVRRVLGAGWAEPVVYTDTGLIRSRGYSSPQQLLDAGWRVD